MKNFYEFTLPELQEYLVENGFKKFSATQLFQGVYKQGKKIEEISNISKSLLAFLKENMFQKPLKLIEKQESKDGTIKFLFELHDGERIETVLMRFGYGNSVCVSSQIGCNIGCRFCASGEIKKVRDLEAGEIVEQVNIVNREMLGKDQRVSHVVVMGIGEPFDNYANVMKFIKVINTDLGLCIGKRNITVSTSGLAPKVIDFAEDESQVNLAISLHAPNDEIRNKIMPINKKYPLADLMDSLKKYQKISNRRITIEYILIKDLNDSDLHAKELVELLRPHNVYVNIIPYNEVVGNEYKRSDRAEKFGRVVRDAGQNVTIRKEKGHDIDAACGQLRSKKGNS